MEPIPSRPPFRMADKGLATTRRHQTGGWISGEVRRPPGYQLAKYIRKRKQKK